MWRQDSFGQSQDQGMQVRQIGPNNIAYTPICSTVKSDTIVFITLHTECPICQYYASDLSVLNKITCDSHIPLVGLFAGKQDTLDIKHFCDAYNIKIPVIQDTHFIWTDHLDAQVTPEIFIYVVSHHKILYRGLIDDTFVGLGKRKRANIQPYFLEAFDAIMKGDVPPRQNTKPIGCPIEKL